MINQIKHTVFMGKVVIIMAAALVYMLISGTSEAHAYLNCDAISGRASAQIDGRSVTFRNSSSQCVHIGVVVYITGSSAGRTFYYSNEAPLSGGASYTFNVPLPRCSNYAIDAIVGKPLRDASSGSSYGNRLITEQVGSSYGSECTTTRTTQSHTVSTYGTAVQTNQGISYVYPDDNDRVTVISPSPTPKPLPVVKAKATPIPTPKPPLPQPKPRVLGAETGPTSTSPLAVSTGSSSNLNLIGIGLISMSALLWLNFRRKPEIVVRII